MRKLQVASLLATEQKRCKSIVEDIKKRNQHNWKCKVTWSRFYSHPHSKGYYTLGYSQFVVPLVQAV